MKTRYAAALTIFSRGNGCFAALVSKAARVVVWARVIRAFRKEGCSGLSNGAAAETSTRRRKGVNWRHSPPRSTKRVFRLLFAMSNTFRFLFVFPAFFSPRGTALARLQI